jgi:hypothetical protein
MLDDDDLDEGEVPPLLGVADVRLNGPPAASASLAPVAVAPTPAPAVDRRHPDGSAKAAALAAAPAAAAAANVSAAPAAVPAPESKLPSSGGGGGLKKGFLSGGSTPRRTVSSSKGAAAKADGSSATAELPVLQADKSKQKKSLELPEIQQQRAAANAPGVATQAASENSWVTPDLMAKITASPILRKAFTDPRCAAAMEALQTDPAGAMKKYGDSAEMREFLQAFMKLMGEHFSALADKQV